MRRPDLRLLCLLAALGCAHGEPFVPRDNGTSGPQNAQPPIQLTFNPGMDLTPSWTADGASILYTYEQFGRSDADRCIGRLPGDGGTRTMEKCGLGDPGAALVNSLESPAEGPDGRLAWVQFEGPAGGINPASGGLRAGTLAASDSGTLVRSLPYTAPSGNLHATATDLQWLDPSTLVYIGSDVAYVLACSGCKYDTLLVGSEITRLDLGTSPATVTVIPGTFGATSLWVASDGGAYYYTLQNDSNVYRQAVAGGAVTVAHDFGAGHIPRDISVAGTTLLAVVDGHVFVQTIPVSGDTQRDEGGLLTRVDLTTGIETRLPDFHFFYRRARLSPAGTAIVAQAYPLTIDTIRDNTGVVTSIDTSIALNPDLRLVQP